jgi:5-methylcytosine-specific restriction endonuclease McrA
MDKEEKKEYNKIYREKQRIKQGKEIKERDGGCLLCNITFEDLRLLKRRIHIHHINYDKKCNIPQNLISLCTSCHMKTNFNRQHWTKFFQSLLSERYGYQYSENGEIILNLDKQL